MPRVPKLPTEELLRLAQEVIARLKTPVGLEGGLIGSKPSLASLQSVTSPSASRAFPEIPAPPDISPLDSEVTQPGPVLDAAKAMTRVINATIGRFSPTKIVPEGPKAEVGRAISPDDIRHQAARYLLRDVSVNPNKSVEELVRGVEPSLAQWVENKTALFSGEPRSVARKRRMVAKAGTIRGRDPNDADVIAARDWLKKEGLLQHPETIEATGELPAYSPSPEEVLMSQQGEDLSRTAKALNTLHELITKPNFLTDKQRQALNLRYNLSGNNEAGPLSFKEVGKMMSIGETPATNHIKNALAKLQKTMEKAGITFDKPPEVQGPPTYWPRTSYVRTPEGWITSVMKLPELRTVPGAKPPLTRTFAELLPPKSKPTAPTVPTPGEELLPHHLAKARARLRELLQTIIRNPSTGEPLFPARTVMVPQTRRVVVTDKAPKVPADLPLEMPKIPPKKTLKELEAQFANTRPSRLVPDPNGEVVIGDQRFRRVPVVMQWVRDPSNKRRLKRIIVDAQ